MIFLDDTQEELEAEKGLLNYQELSSSPESQKKKVRLQWK
tara:strand:- start:99690 stop:99809 length:120 start_codon:yes stop_codon:yes gene_type:complete